jgi:hypothetical protein
LIQLLLVDKALTENDQASQPCMCELCVPNLDLAAPPPSADSGDDDDEGTNRIPLHVWAARAVFPLVRAAKAN